MAPERKEPNLAIVPRFFHLLLSSALYEVSLSHTSDTQSGCAYQGHAGVSDHATGEYTSEGSLGGLSVSDLAIRE